jgi:hypothetical protein
MAAEDIERWAIRVEYSPDQKDLALSHHSCLTVAMRPVSAPTAIDGGGGALKKTEQGFSQGTAVPRLCYSSILAPLW